MKVLRLARSERKCHQRGGNIHHPVSNDERGKGSCAQVHRNEDEHTWKKSEKPVSKERHIEFERKKTVLYGPPKSYQDIGNPAMPGKSGESRGEVSVIGEFLCDRPDGPPDEQGIEDAPMRQVTSHEFQVRGWRAPGVVNDAPGERLPQHEEGKNQQETREALRKEPARKRPEEVADAEIFAPCENNEADETAYIDERAPDGPPHAPSLPGRIVTLQSIVSGKEALTEEDKNGARR